MKIIQNIKEHHFSSTSLALGFFDGLHHGHKKVVFDAIEKSKKLGTTSTVLTFANHPIEVLWNVKPEFITSLEERLELFEQIGVGAVVVLDFTQELAHMNAQDYMKNIILALNPKSITIGYNHHFGSDKSGHEIFLKSNAQKFGFEVSVIPPVMVDNRVISSTLIRECIKEGNTQLASKYLERMYKIKNTVIHGEQRGRTIGFPTANLTIPNYKIVPAFGVYSGYVNHMGNIHKAIINVGKRPTFADLESPLIEVHIFDFDKDIYDEIIEVSFYKKIRNEQKFNNIEELKQQIEADYNMVKQETYNQ